MVAGLVGTYDLTVGVKLDFEDTIYLLDPTDTPLQNGYEGTGLTTLTYGTCFEKKVEWQDEELLIPDTTLNGAHTDSTTTLAVPSDEAEKFGVGDVVRINDELLRITAADYGADTFTVTRSFGGTTNTAHSDGDAVKGVGKALPEGSDPETARAFDRTNRHNYTQIFGPEKVEVSESENAVQKYGVPGTEFDKQVGNRIREASVAFEQALLYGGRFEDTSNKLRTMGGFTHYIQTNVDSSTTTLDEAALVDQVQATYDAGGSPDRIDVGSTQKRNISGFDSSIVRFIEGTEAAKGRGHVVDYIDTDFGRLWVGLNRWIRSTDLFIRKRDQSQVKTLRPMQFEMLAKTGDARKGQVVAERTLRFDSERHAARFSALT